MLVHLLCAGIRASPTKSTPPRAIPAAFDAPQVCTVCKCSALVLIQTLLQGPSTALVVFRLGAFLQTARGKDTARLLESVEIYRLTVALVLVLLFQSLVARAMKQRSILSGGISRGKGQITEARCGRLIRVCGTATSSAEKGTTAAMMSGCARGPLALLGAMWWCVVVVRLAVESGEAGL